MSEVPGKQSLRQNSNSNILSGGAISAKVWENGSESGSFGWEANTWCVTERFIYLFCKDLYY